MITLWIVLLLGSALALVLLLRRAPGQAYADAEANRPSILDGATTILVKRKLAIRRPFALHGEPDIVYLTARGTILLREDKTAFPRPQSERIQLSVYAALLRHSDLPELRGRPIEPVGLVRYGIPGRTPIRWELMPLLNDDDLQRLLDRRQAILRGEPSTRTRDAGMCRARCHHLASRCTGA